jgi:hypothetical protein
VGLQANEILREFNDHAKFARECLSIRDKNGKTVPFVLQPAQIKLNKIVQDCRAKGRPARIIVLKARQVMISAGTAAQFMHAVPFRAGQKALIVAHEHGASKNIFTYYEQLLNNYQPFGGVVAMPARKVDAPAAGVIEWTNGSYIRVATANNLKTGRSFSLRYLHLSEYAFWTDAKTLMTGLMQSVPDDPDTCVVIESTANGVGGDFYQRWKEASDPTSGSEWIPMFFAWWEHPQYVREIQDKVAFQASITREEQELIQKYSLTLEQIHWRRWAIRNKCGGSEDTFKQEYPGCPEEAFLFTGRPRFSHAHLARMPVKDDGMPGELEEFASGTRRELSFLPTGKGAAFVLYKRPQINKRYVIGIDVAEGNDLNEGVIGQEDPDYTVATVLDADTGEQVCKMRGRMSPGPAGEYIAALGRWYHTAFLVPEANGPGIALIQSLLQQGYPPFAIYKRRPDPHERFTEQTTADTQTLGWKTSAVTRQLLISDLDMAIRNFEIWVTDPVTLDELRTFVIKGKREEGQDGQHDDEVIAIGLAYQGMKAMPADERLKQMRQLRAQTGNKPASSGTVKRYGGSRLSSEQSRTYDLLRW